MAGRFWTYLLAGVWAAAMNCGALAQSLNARQVMDAANRDRARHGLGPLRWNPALAQAAQTHANRMVWERELSHQYPGEPDLVARTAASGAHFQTVAENLAVGPSPQALENEWMHSPPHRRNILDPRLNEIGVGIVEQNGSLWAVEDFAAGVPNLGSSQIERKVDTLLTQNGIRPLPSSPAARQTCAMDHGFAGARPGFIMRWQSSNLNRLPGVLVSQIRSGRFRTAAVGACNASNANPGFTTYRVAVLLY